MQNKNFTSNFSEQIKYIVLQLDKNKNLDKNKPSTHKHPNKKSTLSHKK